VEHRELEVPMPLFAILCNLDQTPVLLHLEVLLKTAFLLGSTSGQLFSGVILTLTLLLAIMGFFIKKAFTENQYNNIDFIRF
jgi:hypothetical protein